jgi:hypothetical protein
MIKYLFWSEEHGEVEIFALDEQGAWDKFYDRYNGNGDYEVTLEQITEGAHDD